MPQGLYGLPIHSLSQLAPLSSERVEGRCMVTWSPLEERERSAYTHWDLIKIYERERENGTGCQMLWRRCVMGYGERERLWSAWPVLNVLHCLTRLLLAAGYTITDIKPDYVVIGETKNYNIDRMEKAINLVKGGAKLIGTNCDLLDKSVTGFLPACGTLVAPIVLVCRYSDWSKLKLVYHMPTHLMQATGADAYFVGKPNPLIMRLALSRLGCNRQETVIIGDR